MPLRGRQRTRRYNNNAGALTIFWKSGGVPAPHGRNSGNLEGPSEVSGQNERVRIASGHWQH
jgi:hypothetical protein